MSSSTMAEQRQVFLACKAIFSGPNALLRKEKPIKKLITEHKSSLCKLIPGFDVNRVSLITKELLKDGVFQSEVKARLMFPNVPTPSMTKKREHGTCEGEATRTVIETVQEIEPVREIEKGEITQAPPIVVSVEVEASAEEKTHINERITSLPSPPLSVEAELRIPSLCPLYFPYHAQHFILSNVQQLLEECCFDFLSPELPDGSLHSSVSEFLTCLGRASEIRHTAVHRAPTTAQGVDMLVVSAMRLTEALRDTLRTSQLEDLHLDIQAKIKEMEFNKNALEEDLRRELEAIQRQREELDRREMELRAKVITSENENKSHVGLLVKEAMSKIFGYGAHENSSTGYTTADEMGGDD
ncbi:hypothetical protein BDV26DRAFT_301180 [Aspergillus bertholletiae]|uniref:Uncharacterized protein n=1 Tax=Aspergillus bertholletiae TaxID=1226010 RepID=A0A5N7AWC6_9EURO|nr:hypothetical protein BDV26DRAFT_301180 [Aspergillus bertholletiae]